MSLRSAQLLHHQLQLFQVDKFISVFVIPAWVSGLHGTCFRFEQPKLANASIPLPFPVPKTLFDLWTFWLVQRQRLCPDHELRTSLVPRPIDAQHTRTQMTSLLVEHFLEMLDFFPGKFFEFGVRIEHLHWWQIGLQTFFCLIYNIISTR